MHSKRWNPITLVSLAFLTLGCVVWNFWKTDPAASIHSAHEPAEASQLAIVANLIHNILSADERIAIKSHNVESRTAFADRLAKLRSDLQTLNARGDGIALKVFLPSGTRREGTLRNQGLKEQEIPDAAGAVFVELTEMSGSRVAWEVNLEHAFFYDSEKKVFEYGISAFKHPHD